VATWVFESTFIKAGAILVSKWLTLMYVKPIERTKLFCRIRETTMYVKTIERTTQGCYSLSMCYRSESSAGEPHLLTAAVMTSLRVIISVIG